MSNQNQNPAATPSSCWTCAKDNYSFRFCENPQTPPAAASVSVPYANNTYVAPQGAQPTAYPFVPQSYQPQPAQSYQPQPGQSYQPQPQTYAPQPAQGPSVLTPPQPNQPPANPLNALKQNLLPSIESGFNQAAAGLQNWGQQLGGTLSNYGTQVAQTAATTAAPSVGAAATVARPINPLFR